MCTGLDGAGVSHLQMEEDLGVPRGPSGHLGRLVTFPRPFPYGFTSKQ